MKKSVREKKFFSKNTFSDLELSIIFKELSIMTGENIPVQKLLNPNLRVRREGL